MILEKDIIKYLEETNLLLFIDDVEVETINDFFVQIIIPNYYNKDIMYNGLKLKYESLIYDKEKRILYLDLDNDIKIELRRNEFLKIENIESLLHISKYDFTSELTNCEEIEYPVFETSIKNLYDENTTLVEINMRYYLEQIEPICVHSKIYNDFNLALNETVCIKSKLKENKDTILKLQKIYDEQIEASILVEGTLYKFNYIKDGYLVLNELSEYYNPRNRYVELHELFNRSFTIISNGEYIVYDGNIYMYNKICEMSKIPKNFKGSYYESIFRFYDTITQNAKLDDEKLDCIKNDIKENYKKLSEKERDFDFYGIIGVGIVFIEKNVAIKFNEKIIKHIDSIMEEI